MDRMDSGETNQNEVVVPTGPSELHLKEDETFDVDKFLPEAEEDPEAVKKQKEEEEKLKKKQMVSFSTLFFHFATWKEKLMMFLGSVAALVSGGTMPASLFLFGTSIGNFVSFDEANADDFLKESLKISLLFLAFGGVAWVSYYLHVGMWMWSGERMARKIRLAYFRAVLRQDIAWYDTNKISELTSKISRDTSKIQEAISEKVGTSLFHLCSFFVSYGLAFYKGWKLTLVLLSVAPVLIGLASIWGWLLKNVSLRTQTSYAKAGSVAEEVFGAVRTVCSLSGEHKEMARYAHFLIDARKAGITRGILTGSSFGFTYFILFCSYALAFWYGGRLFQNGEMSSSSVLIVFFCVIIGSFGLGGAAPGFTSVFEGKVVAWQLHELLKRQPPIDSMSTAGEQINISGEIEFRDVYFNYPSRPDVPILKGLSLRIPSGKTVALVGPSGCGKSTVVSLVERFYDAQTGEVIVDGTNIKNINVTWLRQHVGIVGQEPSLFNLSIKENIALGKKGEATMEEIIEAAKQANIHDFIESLPQKYETYVGEKGIKMSGGQKQRIAIARALVRSPKILLLDEATSALDYESEGIVQDALEKASKGRTTIIIAHRLSTVQHADQIIVINEGNVVEQGTHSELMELQGSYYNLVKSQLLQREKKAGEGGADGEQEHVHGHEQHAPMLEKIADTTSSSLLISGTFSDDDAPLQKKGKKEKHEKHDVSFLRIAKTNQPEYFIISLGILASAVYGMTMPIFGIIFSKITNTFSYTGDEFDRESRFWSLMFVVLGVAAGVSLFFVHSLFELAAERSIMRLRNLCFKTMIRQEISWFDMKENGTGSLTTRLSNDCSQFQGMFGINLGIWTTTAVALLAGIIIAFVSGWRLTLVILGCIPLLMFANLMAMNAMKGYTEQARASYEHSGKLTTDAISNIRTVSSLNVEEIFMKLYDEQLEGPYRLGVKRAHINGFNSGLSQFFLFGTNCVGFYFGSREIESGHLSAEQMIRVFASIVFCSMSVGQSLALSPDFSKAKEAAYNIFKLLDKSSTIDPLSTDGLSPPSVHGEIEFKDVDFFYPTRPSAKILDRFSLKIPAGKMYALVGASGCGKSTTVALIERFYDATAGQIFLDGAPLRDLNLHWLREQIGYVGQEPVIFNKSIKENILYGVDRSKRHITDEEIIQVCKQANIHYFISRLPQGYDTVINQTKLSGGQKQRLAIARAVIRNPRILLLDEATSALDAQSERIVQSALDKVRMGRTTIAIAHRLSTITGADQICVIKKGQIIEQGTHEELMAEGGLYTMLVNSAAQR